VEQSLTTHEEFQVRGFSRRDRRWTPTNSRHRTKKKLRDAVLAWRAYYDQVRIRPMSARTILQALLLSSVLSLGACTTAAPPSSPTVLVPPNKPTPVATTARPGREPYELTDIPGDVATNAGKTAVGSAGGQARTATRGATGVPTLDRMLGSAVSTTFSGVQRWLRDRP
jgi:hypothetical protein